MSSQFTVVVLALVAALRPAGASSVATSSSATAMSASNIAAYNTFLGKYRRDQNADSVSFETRLKLFAARRAEVERHNAKPGITWRATVNKFADYTPEEHRALLGYQRTSDWAPAWSDSSTAASLLETEEEPSNLAQSVDWRHKLNSSGWVRNQGGCGSCWAVAAASALEMHAEMTYRGLHASGERGDSAHRTKGRHKRHMRTENGEADEALALVEERAALPAQSLSYEQLVDCTPNPQECGGQGGCKGATAELAFKYTKQHRLAVASGYKGGYEENGDGKCKEAEAGAAMVEIGGFKRLPVNKLNPLLRAVAKGPVVVSVAADGWSGYEGGVFGKEDACERNATINHAVLLEGYGHDPKSGLDYWVIRNSWGDDWGENGRIRLERHSSDEGKDGYCGTDHSPQEGVGCKGGPKTLPVCGMCGVLSDSSYPLDVKIVKP